MNTYDPIIVNSRQLATGLQTIIDKELSLIEPTEWMEDFISMSVVRAIRKVLKVINQIQFETVAIRLEAEVYKVSGTPEHSHGDIVVAINHVYSDHMSVRGLGFYEAKAANTYGLFPAFEYQKFKKLVTLTPNLSLLLYERQPSPATSEPSLFSYMDMDRYNARDLVRARTIQGKIVKHLGSPQMAIGYAQPFGFHFVTRYLMARDLEYSQEPQKLLEKWLKDTKHTSPNIISLAITSQKTYLALQEPLSNFHLPLPENYEILPPSTPDFSLFDKGLFLDESR